MGFVQRELDRLGRALCDGSAVEQYAEIYAAQQALAWALEPTLIKRPSQSYITRIAGDGEDCSVDTHRGM